MFLRDLLAALSDASVPYAVVGGVAVNLHGVPRMTYDVDLVVPATADAYARLGRALSSLGLVPRLPVELSSLAQPDMRRALKEERHLLALTFTDPSSPLREVDVLLDPDIDADGIVSRAELRPFGRETLRLCTRGDLLALKRHAGRPQDLADLALLEDAP
jgi:hypothetical protein